MNEPKLIDCGSAFDDRGRIRFCMEGVPWDTIQRFYSIKNYKKQFVRAWHGHLLESKYVWIAKGAAMFKLTPLDTMITITEDVVIENPVKEGKIYSFVLDENCNKMLYIPPNYFNGFKTLVDESEIMFFSDATLEQSKIDDYRMDINKFKPEIWDIKER